jgi:putative SOS response-associated peptidase YedK
MCYSAQLVAAHHRYLRLTGAEMDFEQFKEIYGIRAQGAPVRVPRTVDRWFSPEGSAAERELARLAAEYQASEIAKLERELFALRKRIADAERALARKPTKTAAESKRIATSKTARALERLERLRNPLLDVEDARIFPMYHAPIVLQAGDRRVVRLARYHLRRSGDPETVDRKWPGLYNARRDNLERFWRGQFGSTHAVMLAESFFENVQRDGRNHVLQFTPRPAGAMYVACLYAEWTDPRNGRRLLSFAAVTDEPPPEVAAAGHDRMIVSLKPENVEAWLTPEGRTTEELQEILSDRQAPYYEHVAVAA